MQFGSPPAIRVLKEINSCRWRRRTGSNPEVESCDVRARGLARQVQHVFVARAAGSPIDLRARRRNTSRAARRAPGGGASNSRGPRRKFDEYIARRVVRRHRYLRLSVARHKIA